jgi:hypothetical protein
MVDTTPRHDSVTVRTTALLLLAVAAVLVTGVAVAGGSQPVALEQPDATGTLTGQVTDADTGDPIPNATVVAANPEQQVFETTTTGPNGEYTLTLEAGTYVVGAVHPDYEVGVEPEVTVFAGETTEQDLALSPTAGGEDPALTFVQDLETGASTNHLWGTLVTGDQNRTLDEIELDYSGTGTDLSDVDGPLPPPPDVAIVRNDGLVTAPFTTSSSNGGEVLTIDLDPRIIGDPPEVAPGDVIAVALINEQVENPPTPGGYNASIALREDGTTFTGGTAGFRIVDATGTIAGEVTDVETGDPIPNATVVATNESEGFIRGGLTDDTGGYEFGAPVAEYDVTVFDPDYGSETATNVSVSEDETTEVDFQLAPDPVDPSGLVIEDRAANAETDHAWVTLLETDGQRTLETVELDYAGTGTDLSSVTAADVDLRRNGTTEVPVDSATTGPDGEVLTLSIDPGDAPTTEPGDVISVATTNATVTNPPEGSYNATLRFGNGTTFQERTEAFDVLAPAGTLTGNVTDSTTGAPIDNATVLSVNATTGVVDAAVTDSDGTYSTALPAGTYNVSVGHPNYTLATETGVAVQSGETTELDVGLDPIPDETGTVEGTVTDAGSGIGVENAAVFLINDSGAVAGTATGDGGAYNLTAPIGTYNLTVTHPGYDTATVADVTVGENETTRVDVQLVPASAPDFAVSVQDVSDPVEAGDDLLVEAAVTNVGVAAGQQDVTLTVDGTRVDSETVVIQPGETWTGTLRYETGPDDVPSVPVAVETANDTAQADARVHEQVPDHDVGDVDGNGEITIVDAVRIQRHLANLDPGPFDPELADVQRTGEITIVDAVRIQRYLAQIDGPATANVTSLDAPDEVAVGEPLNVSVNLTNSGGLGTVQAVDFRLAEDRGGLDGNATEAIAVIDLGIDDNVVTEVTIDTAGLVAGTTYHLEVVTDDDSAERTVTITST